MTLDLRKETDLERSLFFHRLALLDIDWAKPETAGGKGTFKEKWSLYHRPEQIVCIIERAVWGNTVEEAVQKYVSDRMTGITRIPELTGLLDRVIPANLPELVEAMTIRLDRLSAAIHRHCGDDRKSVPDLVNIVRYGECPQSGFQSRWATCSGPWWHVSLQEVCSSASTSTRRQPENFLNTCRLPTMPYPRLMTKS